MRAADDTRSNEVNTGCRLKLNLTVALQFIQQQNRSVKIAIIACIIRSHRMHGVQRFDLLSSMFCVSVCLLDIMMSCAKTVEPIKCRL